MKVRIIWLCSMSVLGKVVDIKSPLSLRKLYVFEVKRS